jgi:hypothetical protein
MRAMSSHLPRARLALGLAAMAVGVTLWTAAPSRAAAPGECEVHSLPSFVAQGLGLYAASVADVVEVACAGAAGDTVTLEDSRLYGKCGDRLDWAEPFPYSPSSGSSSNVTLDAFGNATAVMWSSGCKAGETEVIATLDAPPGTTVMTTFAVLPPDETQSGVYALPSHQVEGGEYTFATIIELEVPNGAENRVAINAANLHNRCRSKPHLHWIYEGKEKSGAKTVTEKLDNNGNAFAIVLGGPGCQTGESLIVGELVDKPYTQDTTSFVLEPPREIL